MKTLCLIPIYFLLCLGPISAQEVISSTGEHYENTAGSVSWTIGEPIGLTLKSTEGYVTQGFHQPVQSMLSLEPSIPTLGVWSLVILGLLLMTIGVVAVQNAKDLAPE